MRPLNAIFSQQEAARTSAEGKTFPDECAYIRFSIAASIFVVPIENVVEVSELVQIVPYPEAAFGHEGIVNLRGNILPVLNFRDQQQGKLRICENRLLVLEFQPGERFCALVSSPKKITLAFDKLSNDQEILSIDGMPVRLLSQIDFPASCQTKELK
ncbi:MAG: chemotaxis protein CheW [Bdellovibrionota bacterium]